MDSNMSTAAYVHRAGGSSSASSTCTSSLSGAGMTTNGGGGGSRMAVIGVTRNVKLRRRGASGFGFSLRGGREYAAGFYVSDVVPGGEAHRNGLRVGDQILRVNGYPVEDAVHQEVALLAKNQQVLVLKIRSVGMIPVKDNPNDPVTWHMVQQQQQQLQYGDAVSNEIRIRILVGEKGRLGCGVCRGIVPGLTVQGTREGGPARAAGLKAGDIILWCNGQSLTDLPFERAIEVMRNAAVLDLVVNRPIVSHVYDCPEALWMGGSNGYDSESSSIAGPNPSPMHLPNPASSPQHRATDQRLFQQTCNRNGRNFYPPNGSGPSDWGHVEQSQEWTRKPNNTTVIRISQSQPQQQQQQFRRAPRQPMRAGSAMYDDTNDLDEEPLYDPVAPKDFECHDFDANPRDEIDRRAEYRREHNIREPQYNESTIDGVFVKLQENGQADGIGGVGNIGSTSVVLGAQRQGEKERKTVTTVEVHQPCPPTPPSMPPSIPYKWAAETKPMNAMGMQMGSTMSMGSTGSTETESSLESSCGGKDTASTSSSLSTSSCEPTTSVSFVASIAAAAASGGGGLKLQERPASRPSNTGSVKIPPPPPPSIDLSTAITQELQRRAKQRSMNNAAAHEASQVDKPGGVQEPRKPQNPEALRAQEQKVTHDKLMEEFKRAHQRMFSNAQQRNQSTEQSAEQTEAKRANPTSLGLPVDSVKVDKRSSNDDAVEMQSIESFKLKESPSVHVPKPPPTYFPSSSPRKLGSDCAQQNGASKPRSSAICINQNASADKVVSKVAIRIGTYETDAKQPSRLGFLSHAAEDKLNSGGSPVASRLQNELVATLQRSNLRKKIEAENEIPNPSGEISKANQENSQVDAVVQSNVEKLATNLNKVTIRVNPEASNR